MQTRFGNFALNTWVSSRGNYPFTTYASIIDIRYSPYVLSLVGSECCKKKNTISVFILLIHVAALGRE